MPGFLHILLAILGGIAGGAVWGGIAGALKAFAGTNEVISTIMLNWIAVWVGVWVFNLGSPLQNSNPAQVDVPVSNDIVEAAKLPVFWGNPLLQGLHVGIFIALAALLVFWVLLNRTTLGYEVRAVGFSPDAAQASGISVGRNYIIVMAVCGAFAGLAGTLDVLGWQFRIATNDIQLINARLHRDRGRAARSQHGDRDAVLGPAVRRARPPARRRAPSTRRSSSPRSRPTSRG